VQQKGCHLEESAKHARNQNTCWKLPAVHGNIVVWQLSIQSVTAVQAHGSGLFYPEHILQTPTCKTNYIFDLLIIHEIRAT